MKLNKCALKLMGKQFLCSLGVLVIIGLIIKLYIFLAGKYHRYEYNGWDYNAGDINWLDAFGYMIVIPFAGIFSILLLVGAISHWYETSEINCKSSTKKKNNGN